MKKLVAVSLSAFAGAFLAVYTLGLSLSTQAEGNLTATKNGDTNGDGGVDISDAVYLLSYLFSGGAEIASIECPATSAKSSILATGQTTCFGSQGEIDCSLPKAQGQDAFYGLGCPVEGRFLDNGDGTVSDLCTGLQWTKRNVDVNGDGEIVIGNFAAPSPDMLEWLEACQFAEGMTFAGHDDWRVPNANELLSLLDFSDRDPLLNSIFEIHSTWTSTHRNVAYSYGYHLNTGSSNCDCCPLMSSEHSKAQLFAAVRGP